MHPDLAYFLKAARPKTKYYLSMNTNGILFNNNEDFMAEVIRSGLDHLDFSTEGYDTTTYEKFRVGAKFDDFLSNLKLFKKVRDRLNPKVKLDLSYCLVREHTTEEFKKIFETYADYVDEIDFSPLNNQAHADIPYNPDVEIYGCKYYNTSEQNACNLLWLEPTVLWDGRVSACSRNYAGELITGDIRKRSIFDIWKGEEYRAIRLAHGRKCFPENCQNCFELFHDGIQRYYINKLIRKSANLPDKNRGLKV
jgi:MoaA/NifB/PqqE/SkfB family radical SAM enzyme